MDIDDIILNELDEIDVEKILYDIKCNPSIMISDVSADPFGATDTFTWDELDDLEDYMGMILATAQDAEDYDDVEHLKMCLSEIATYAETALNRWNGED